MTRAEVLEACGMLETAFRIELTDTERALWMNRSEHVPPYLLGEAIIRCVDHETRAPRIGTVFRYIDEVRQERAAVGQTEGRSARQSMKVVRETIESVYRLRSGTLALNYPDYTRHRAAEDCIAGWVETANDLESRDIDASTERRWVVAAQYVIDEELTAS